MKRPDVNEGAEKVENTVYLKHFFISFVDPCTLMFTYQDLIQIGILVVALANLIYQIYKGKKK